MFLVRFVTEAEAEATEIELEEASKLTDRKAASEKVEEILRRNVTGWRNLAVNGKVVEFMEGKRFAEVLHSRDIWELAARHLRGVMPDDDDELGLRSPQQSGPV